MSMVHMSSPSLVVAFLLGTGGLAFAQDSQQDQSVETLKVRVNVVQLFFNVKDKKGALIPDQKKDDFDVFEDGKPQTIKYFTAESNLPLTLGIMIDSSGSQTRVLDMEKEVGGAFLRQILTDKDLAYVMDFDIRIRFGRAIRRIREEQKINQEEAAERCGLHRTYYSGVERGVRNVSLVNIEKIAKGLRKSLPELFGRV